MQHYIGLKRGIWNKLTKCEKSIIFEENFDETQKTIYGYVKKIHQIPSISYEI